MLPGKKAYAECKRNGFITDDFWLMDEPMKIYTPEHSIDEPNRMQKKVLNYNMRAWWRNEKDRLDGRVSRVKDVVSGKR